MNIALRNDLKKGMGLDEALKKHNTNLFEELRRKNEVSTIPTRKYTKNIEDRYIYQSYNQWAIKKTLNCEYMYFGCYDSLKEARIVRDELIKCGWDKEKLPQILKKHNIRLPSIFRHNKSLRYIAETNWGTYKVSKRMPTNPNRSPIYVGTYSTLEDAQIIRDEMEKCGWDKSQLDDIKLKWGIKDSQGR